MKTHKTYSILFTALAIVVVMACSSDMERNFEPESVGYPEIMVEGFSPQEGMPGTEVIITGANFGEHSDAASVLFNEVEAEEILSYTDTEMTVIVPQDASSGAITVKVWDHTVVTETSFHVLPGAVINSISPEEASPGEQVTIHGENFGNDISEVSVFFTEEVSAEVISINDTEIVVEVPEEGISGPITVHLGPQTLTTPRFNYPFVGLDFPFDEDGNTEGWVAMQNAAYEVSDGSFNVTFDPAQFGGGNKRRADLQLQNGVQVQPGTFPIVAIKINKPQSGNFILDTNLGSYKNGSNNWEGVYNGNVYYYDLTNTFGSGNTLPANEVTQLSTFQFKIADVTTDEEGYSVDWIRSFESVSALEDYVALPEGKYVFEFDNPNATDWLPAQNATYEISDGKLKVDFDPMQFEGGNKRRADLQYIINGSLNGQPKDDWVYTSDYPIFAIKFVKPESGNLFPDIRNLSFSNNDYEDDFEDQDVYYWDLSEQISENQTTMDLFQLKIADITSSEEGYEVFWIRTFESVQALDDFIE